MRKRILELLRNSKGTPVSGEEISRSWRFRVLLSGSISRH